MPAWDTSPPPSRTRAANEPTLLFSWWCTGFSLVIILVRLCGRKIRSNVLFREDWIMMMALAPLLIRMGLVHVVLLFRTNNVQTVGHTFTDVDLHHREIGSKLILAARISYALFIWVCKLTVSEFLKRITIRIWRPSYEYALQAIRVFLAITFVVVVIATLTECHPFNHYWQVAPDPGPQCRQGYANLIAMGTCDIITDILLVAFPIPIVLRSGQTWKRKLQLAALFSLSVIMIGITATRVPEVIAHLGLQQYRTVWASIEILASTAVANAIILGSMVRDKGTKKNKYRSRSATDSLDRTPSRRPTMANVQHGNSEEDLFRSLGIRIPAHLTHSDENVPRLAPVALSAAAMQDLRCSSRRSNRSSPERPPLPNGSAIDIERQGAANNSDSSLSIPPVPKLPSPSASNSPSISLYDAGGLLEPPASAPSPSTRSRSSTQVRFTVPDPITMDFAPPTPHHSERGSRAHTATDVSVNSITPSTNRSSHNAPPNSPRRLPDQSTLQRPRTSAPPAGILGPMLERRESDQSLQDAGGLLGGAHDMYDTPRSQMEQRRTARLQDLGAFLREDRRRDVDARSPPPSTSAMPGNFEGMELGDAGGLLERG